MTTYATNVQTLLAALVGPAVTLETALQQLLTQRGLDTAIGVQLDQIGTIVGRKRAGEVDDVYRRYLRAQVAVNRSRGTMADVYKVAHAILGVTPTLSLEIKNQGIAALVLLIFGDTVDAGAQAVLQVMLRHTVAAGVRIIEEITQAPDSDTFFTPSAFTTLNGAHASGAATLTVASTAGFAPTGSLVLEAVFGKSAETVTYSGKTPTTFTGVSTFSVARADLTGVAFNGPGKGWGDSSDVTVGGKFASAQD